MSLPDDHRGIASNGAKRVLVAGATGRFGGIVELLLARGHQVRAATRNPGVQAATRLARAGAEIVRADFDDVASLAAAAQDMDAVFASGTAHRAGPDGEERHGKNLAKALAGLAAPRLVFVSGTGADRVAGVPVLDAKQAVERRIRELRLAATVIAPVYLMENLFNPWNLAALRAGVVPTPVPPAVRLQQAATADILALAVLAIEDPDDFAGERIELASHAPTGDEAATLLTSLLDSQFTARQLPRSDLAPGLAALFAWLEKEPSPVEIGALHQRFPGIAWHRFGDWATQQRARLTEVVGRASGPAPASHGSPGSLAGGEASLRKA